MHADVSVHSAAVDADESWGAIGSLSVMVAALPAQEELFFAFTAARRRGRTAHVSSIQTRTFLEGTSTACLVSADGGDDIYMLSPKKP